MESSGTKDSPAAIHVCTHGVMQPYDKGHVLLDNRGGVQRSVPIGVPVVNVPWMVLHPLTQLSGRKVPKGDVGGRRCHFVG